MKNLIYYFFLAVFIFNCTSSKIDRKLLGNWYYSSDSEIVSVFHFYKDSLIIDERTGKSTLKWSIKNHKIYSSFLKENGPEYEYQLNQKNNNLYLRLIESNGFDTLNFIKAKNDFDFLKKHIDLNIVLPESNTLLEPIGYPDNLNFNIYAGYKYNNLIVKTDSSSNLNNLVSEVNKFKETSRGELKQFLRFNLIADKNIPNYQIDSIKECLNKTSINRIFRTYKNEKIDYKNDLNWFGIKEPN